MTKENKQNSGVLTRIYLILLFGLGVMLGFSFISFNENKIFIADQKLDNAVVSVLTSNGVSQSSVVIQFAKENKIKGAVYNEYYKKIKIPKNKKIKNFELSFKNLAVNFKIDLSKTIYKDGSCKYIFYDKDRTYSTVVLIK